MQHYRQHDNRKQHQRCLAFQRPCGFPGTAALAWGRLGRGAATPSPTPEETDATAALQDRLTSTFA